MKLAPVAKRLVEDARVLKSVVVVAELAKKLVEVALAITEEEARRVPFNVIVLAADLYTSTSPNDIPPVEDVDDARESREAGVVVPNPRRLVLLL